MRGGHPLTHTVDPSTNTTATQKEMSQVRCTLSRVSGCRTLCSSRLRSFCADDVPRRSPAPGAGRCATRIGREEYRRFLDAREDQCVDGTRWNSPETSPSEWGMNTARVGRKNGSGRVVFSGWWMGEPDAFSRLRAWCPVVEGPLGALSEGAGMVGWPGGGSTSYKFVGYVFVTGVGCDR